MRAPVPQPLRSSSSGLATACRRADAGAGEDPPGGAHALVVPGEVALPDGVLVQRRRQRRARPGDDRAAHPTVSGARGLGVMPRRYVAGPGRRRLIACGRSRRTRCRSTGAASCVTMSRRPSFQAIASRIDGRSPTRSRSRPSRSAAASSRARSTNSAGSCRPRGGPPGSRSSEVHVDQHGQPGGRERVQQQQCRPGRSSRAHSASTATSSSTCSRISQASTTSAQPSASGTSSTEPPHRQHAVLAGQAPARAARCRRPTCRYPSGATCGAHQPAAAAEVDQDAPSRPAGGRCWARQAASQCSVANSAVRLPPLVVQLRRTGRGRCAAQAARDHGAATTLQGADRGHGSMIAAVPAPRALEVRACPSPSSAA